jgi:FkbH-like protein
MDAQLLLAKLRRAWMRDQQAGVTVAERLRKGVHLLSETAAARLALHDCNAVGPGARLNGRVRIANRGSITIGSGLVLHGPFLPVELLTGPTGRIEMGNGVWVNFGTVIAAANSVKIGDGVMIGQHCIIADLEVPEQVLEEGVEARPIEIGDGAWLAGRVTVMPGVKIGAGAVITAGSFVTSDIPPRMLAGGSPARVLRPVGNGSSHDVGHAVSTTASAGTTSAAPHGAPSNGAAATTNGAATGVPAGAPAAEPKLHGILISDFTIDELVDELRVSDTHPGVGAIVAPFGQVNQMLLEAPQPNAADFAVVWTRAEAVSPAFARLLAFETVEEAELFAEVDAFSQLVLRAAPGYKAVFVPNWVLPQWVRGLGMIDLGKRGVARALLAMNLRLADNLAGAANVFVMNTARWTAAAGRGAANPRGWYMGKIAMPRTILAEAAADIRSALAGIGGAARKLLLVDLDDTMWGGIVGDVGWDGLRLGGLDSVGEAFVDFQRAVKSLKQRGVVLGIVSKNEESVALEAIRSHPEMVLRQDDFVGWRINWTDKAKNIADLAADLNLGLQSVVFIDDNPVERARVRETLPEVFVPEWPEDKLLYPSALLALRCFDTPAISQEDVERTRLYAEERNRERLQTQVGSVDEWLKSLQIKVRVDALGPVNLTRATQLLNKTNQLNLATRRLTEAELVRWASDPEREFWTVTVSDRFGDAGLTGLLGLEARGDELEIVDYVLSCRVMGRKVEETMLHVAVSSAVGRGARRVVARYLPTAKNKPCLNFFRASGFVTSDEREFVWDTANAYTLPEPITLEWQRKTGGT